MLKRTIALLLPVMVLLLSTVVYATEPRGTVTPPSLSISNSVATCVYNYDSGNSSNKIDVTLRLYRGQTLVASWPGTGYGSLYMSHFNKSVIPKGRCLV